MPVSQAPFCGTASLKTSACALPGTARFVHGRYAVDGKCVADARAVALAEVERLASRGTRSAGAVAAN